MTERQILNHFTSWSNAVRAAGLSPNTTNIRLDDADLLEDWASLVRRHRQIPTREQYRREGNYSPGSFDKHFGPWSTIPRRFREYATDKPALADVIALIPQQAPKWQAPINDGIGGNGPTSSVADVLSAKYTRLTDRPTFGNPIDFRGLRHEPTEELGVVFIFGMVAKELGYLVEGVQGAFPDCTAKRQVGPDRWQSVRIEFEFETRRFRDHGHPPSGCDVIVCWRHN
jgi:hypothetical protein